MSRKTIKINFEKALQEMEDIVTTLEEGDLSLEESLKYFERGITLTRNCQTALTEAEQKVKILLEKDGEADLQDFTADDETD